MQKTKLNLVTDTITKNGTQVKMPKKMVNVQKHFNLDTPFTGDNLKEIEIPAIQLADVPEIKKDYVWDKKMLRHLLLNRDSGLNLHIFGVKGSGKSEAIEQFHAYMGLPLVKISCVKSMDKEELFGSVRIVDGNTVYEEGLASKCRRRGIPLLLDEIDALSQYMGPVLNGFADIGKDFTVPVGSAKVTTEERKVPWNPWFRLYATSNTGGKAERDPQFAGTSPMNGATKDRFLTFEAHYMAPEVEETLLAKVIPELSQIQISSLVKFATEVRLGYKNGDTNDTVSMRSLIQWGKTWVNYDCPVESFELAIWNDLCSEDKDYVYPVFETHFKAADLNGYVPAGIAA